MVFLGLDVFLLSPNKAYSRILPSTGYGVTGLEPLSYGSSYRVKKEVLYLSRLRYSHRRPLIFLESEGFNSEAEATFQASTSKCSNALT